MGPAVLHPRNLGLFRYGIHAVETLCVPMGPGCSVVVDVSGERTDVVVGECEDGRLGVTRRVRAGQGG